MKKLIFTSIMSVAICCAATVSAQNNGWGSRTGAKPDSVLLSHSREGDYIVRRYLVKHEGDNNTDFSVRYRINVATLLPNSDGNARELAELNEFMESLKRDTMVHVRRVEITGYASPDGVESSNRKLAAARAADFKSFLDKKYGLSEKYTVTTDAVVNGWNACLDDLRRSNVAGSSDAVAVIESRDSMTDKQRRLKAMPKVWSYLAANVLPSLRQADIEFSMWKDEIVVTRVLAEQPKPAPKPRQVERCCCCGCEIDEHMVVIEDLTNGLIVEMDNMKVDW